jgi:hypothetical protein
VWRGSQRSEGARPPLSATLSLYGSSMSFPQAPKRWGGRSRHFVTTRGKRLRQPGSAFPGQLENGVASGSRDSKTKGVEAIEQRGNRRNQALRFPSIRSPSVPVSGRWSSEAARRARPSSRMTQASCDSSASARTADSPGPRSAASGRTGVLSGRHDHAAGQVPEDLQRAELMKVLKRRRVADELTQDAFPARSRSR